VKNLRATQIISTKSLTSSKNLLHPSRRRYDEIKINNGMGCLMRKASVSYAFKRDIDGLCPVRIKCE
jgi:hypothetical protein